MDKNPIYIVFEGLDGTGKTTLFKNIVEKFKSDGVDFQTLCPTYIKSKKSTSEKIYRLLKLKKINFFRTLMFAYRSYKATSNVNWNCDVVLGDRSVVVTFVKHWRKTFNSSRITIFTVNFLEPFIKTPDIIFYFDAPFEVILQRIAQKGTLEIDETPECLSAMKAAYHEIRYQKTISRLKNARWIDVNSNKSEIDLSNEVYSIIQQIITKKINLEQLL